MEALTPRETEIVRLIHSGLQTDEIAKALGISRRTVHAHRERIKLKLGARNIAQIVTKSLALGLIEKEITVCPI